MFSWEHEITRDQAVEFTAMKDLEVIGSRIVPQEQSQKGFLLSVRREDKELRASISFCHRNDQGKPSIIHDFKPGESVKPTTWSVFFPFTEECQSKLSEFGFILPEYMTA